MYAVSRKEMTGARVGSPLVRPSPRRPLIGDHIVAEVVASDSSNVGHECFDFTFARIILAEKVGGVGQSVVKVRPTTTTDYSGGGPTNHPTTAVVLSDRYFQVALLSGLSLIHI